MHSEFNTIRSLYEDEKFVDLIHHPNGVYWLKLRSISRVNQLRQFCQRIDIDTNGIPSRELFAHIYNQKPPTAALEEFIRDLFLAERAIRKINEEYLITQLYQMKVFDWGGLYQNSLEQTIVNNYVKKTQSWEKLNAAIENELHISLKGYVQCSWYNHWSSIIIEDIFKDHRAVLPTIGLVKKVDFFVNDFPFDLKVTYFPDAYMESLRKSQGLRSELAELKAFCRQQHIWFDNNKPISILFSELFARVAEYPSEAAREFIGDFKQTRARLIQKTIESPQSLKIWLYENQGIRRFDAANRFFLILVDVENLDEGWKLKRNRELLIKAIHSHLDSLNPSAMEALRLDFKWNGNTYQTYADMLFVVTNQK